MSSKTIIVPGKLRREVGKGRFDPSEPLHMTTRHAARSVRVNSDPSISGSYEDDDNHSASFDERRPTTSQSLGSPTSAQGRRVSGNSINSATEQPASLTTRSSEKKRRISSGRAPLSPVHRHQSPVRKRKRSSPTPLPDTPNGSEAIATTPPVNDQSYPFEAQFIEVVPREDLSDRGIGPSSPSVSDEQMPDDYMGITESTEFTPAVSEAVSPASEDSDTEAVFPAKDIVKAAFPQTEIDDAEDVDDAEDLADADEVDDVDDADDIDDVDDQARLDGDGVSRRRHYHTGRKRAEHHLPNIEAALRRQLAVKSAYRAIARAVKLVDAEIALKTVEELQANPTRHEEVVEYQGTDNGPGVRKQLDQHLEKRKQQIRAQLKWNQQLLKESHDAEAEVRKSRCKLQIEQLRDLQFDRLEYDMLSIARQAQLSDGNVSHETEDEDGDIVPRPKGMGYRFTRQNALDPKYDSRSRLALEAECATKDLHARYEMTKMLQDFKEKVEHEGTRTFTVMDPRARNAAIARSTSVRNINTLANAAAEVETTANKPVIPVIPNAEAHGLQILGDLASQHPFRPRDEDMKPTAFNPPAVGRPDIQMPPPLAPPLPMRVDLQSLLNNELSPRRPGVQQQFNLPGLSLASHRRSSVPDAVAREPGLLSPISNAGRATAFPSPSATDSTHAGPHRPRESVPPFQHARTVSLGTPSRSDQPRSATTGTNSSPWGHTQPSPGRNADPRNTSAGQVAPHPFSQTGPLRIERVNPAESEESRPPLPAPEDRFNDNSPSNHLLARPLAQSQSRSQWEAASNTEPGASDSRSFLAASPHHHSRDASASGNAIVSVSTPALQQRSRASSMKSQSTSRDTPDASSAGESAQHHKDQLQHSGAQIRHSNKLNKSQRDGTSRRDHKGKIRSSSDRRPSQASPNPDKKPPVIKYPLNSNQPTVTHNEGTLGRFRLNKSIGEAATAQTNQPSSPWRPSPATTPHSGQQGEHQNQNMYAHSMSRYQPVVPPPLPGFNHHYYTDPQGQQQQQQHQHHRSSLPGLPPQWQHPPHSPQVYGMPHGMHPQGFAPSPEHWQQQQQQQQQTPLNPARGPQGTMMPAAASYVPQQYGGPAIAPAHDQRNIYSNAGSANHLPAFAQQLAQQNASNSRKRAQSDLPQQTKFQHYDPSSGKSSR